MARIPLLAGALALLSSSVLAEDLTFRAALDRALEASPALAAARARVPEARARTLGAALAVPGNPTLEVKAGRRTGDARSTELEVDVAQELDGPGRRAARLGAAAAGVAREEARVLEAERTVLLEVATEFVRALEAKERGAAAEAARRLAEETLSIAERRFAAGDVARLDVNLARTSAARARADARAAEAVSVRRLTRLAVLLGSDAASVTVAGSLGESLAPAGGGVPGRGEDRPEIRLLDAEIAEAHAEAGLARALRWPEFGLRGTYAREEGDRVLMGGVGFSLPVFHRGAEPAAAASARLERLRGERLAALRAAALDAEGGRAALEALRAAASEYQGTVIPLAEENERLALESYDVGQIGLLDLLLVRREALDARRAFVDQLVETRLAEVELRARTGVWR